MKKGKEQSMSEANDVTTVESTVSVLAGMVNPQVVADLVDEQLAEAIRVLPLCAVDRSLEGRPGSKVLLPKYAYIGDAVDVAEGEEIPVRKLTASTVEMAIKKAGNGVELTDESLLSGYGDPLGEAVRQLTISIANKVDKDAMSCLAGIGPEMTVDKSTAAISADAVADALVKLGDQADGEKVLLIAPAQLASLRKSESWIKATDIGAKVLMQGTVGMIHGCQVALSSKVKAESGVYTNYIVMPGALAVFLKRDTEAEMQRDIIRKTTVVTVDKHYTVHLANEGKAVKLKVKE